jgi:hypothetical protein
VRQIGAGDWIRKSGERLSSFSANREKFDERRSHVMPPYRDTRHRTEILADRRYAALRRASWRLDAKLVEWIGGARPMTKLAAIAERIKAKKAAHDKIADDWSARLDAVERREPDAFAIGDAVIAEREADLADLESTVRTLTNAPSSDSGPSSTG